MSHDELLEEFVRLCLRLNAEQLLMVREILRERKMLFSDRRSCVPVLKREAAKREMSDIGSKKRLENLPILLVNPQVLKLVCPTCLL